MNNGEFKIDVPLDVIGKDDYGGFYMSSSEKPDIRYEITNMMDLDGDETDDPTMAVILIFKVSEDCWVVREL